MTQAEIKQVYEHVPPAGAKPKQLVILLHGVGSNGQDLISLAPLWAQDLPEAVFVSPDAPFACDMVPPGYPNAYQWFSLQDRDPHKMLQGLESVAPVLDSFITEQMEKYDVVAGNVVLVGFSQGTMTSLYAAPRFPEKLAGVLGYSGALIWGDDTKQEDLQHVPVRLIHGEADDVVPVEAYQFATKTLEDYGFKVSGHTTPGLMHGIDDAGVKSGAAFLKEVLG